jgi:ATP-dependent DNA helicase RecQ
MDEEIFEEDPVKTALKQYFGFDYLFPYQRLVVANILEAAENCSRGETDEDILERGRQIVILPTGAGKSLCFQLPSLLIEGASLVIYPILSLMADQERRLRQLGMEPALLRGGQTREEREAAFEKIRRRETRFIIANPEILLALKEQEPSLLPSLGIQHIVIDEAHCVSEWGESFRPDYLRIGEIIEAIRGEGQTGPLVTAFTATASEPVLEKIEHYIFKGGAHKIMGNPGRANICYEALGAALPDLAVRDLLRFHEKPAIVFCSSRGGTEKLARYLRNELGTDEVRFYHAGLERGEKKEVEDWFFKSPDGVLVATCAYGMGVDKSNIRTVVHRDMAPSVEAYLQESGRAGRDGNPSRAFLLYSTEERKRGGDPPLPQADTHTAQSKKRQAALIAYAKDNSACRRSALLRLLDFEGESDCPESDCCDVCNGKRLGERAGETREEAALLDFFKRNKRRYKLHEAAEALTRSGLDWTREDARDAIRFFLKAGLLETLKNPLWRGRIVPSRKRA